MKCYLKIMKALLCPPCLHKNFEDYLYAYALWTVYFVFIQELRYYGLVTYVNLPSHDDFIIGPDFSKRWLNSSKIREYQNCCIFSKSKWY